MNEIYIGNIKGVDFHGYTGNGKSGIENGHTITFSFKPNIIFISGHGYTLAVPYGQTSAYVVAHDLDYANSFTLMSCEFTYSKETITIYSSTSGKNGFNAEGETYTVTAL